MRIQVLSDLHLEFMQNVPHALAEFLVPEIVGDVLVLAGDIGIGTQGMDAFASTKVPVIYVAGNHEYYHANLNLVNRKLSDRAEELGFHYLDNAPVEVKGVRFLGCTLWTDFHMYLGLKRASMRAAQEKVRDFSCITTSHGLFSPEQSVALHRTSVAWLEQELRKPFLGPTVVVTHHAPSSRSVAYRFQRSELNPAFVSDLDRIAGRAALWLHGHTHDSFDYDWRGTRVVCNPRGYPAQRPAAGAQGQAWENTRFKRDLVVEVPA